MKVIFVSPSLVVTTGIPDIVFRLLSLLQRNERKYGKWNLPWGSVAFRGLEKVWEERHL